MKFEEALTAMREGKKVRSNGGDYIYISDGEIVDEDCIPKRFSYTEILAVDWEIYEEQPVKRDNMEQSAITRR